MRLSAEEPLGGTALSLALKANELSIGNQPLVLDLLGLAYAETGDFTNAVTRAQNAAELADPAKLKSLEAIRHHLELYKTSSRGGSPSAPRTRR